MKTSVSANTDSKTDISADTDILADTIILADTNTKTVSYRSYLLGGIPT